MTARGYSEDILISVSPHANLTLDSWGEAQSTTEFRAMVEYATIGLIYFKESTVTYCNPHAALAFGYSLDELTDKNTEYFCLSAEDHYALVRDSEKVIAGGGTYNVERLMRHKNGHSFWCRLSIRSTTVDPLSSSELWVIEDVNEDRQLRETLLSAQLELSKKNQQKCSEIDSLNKQLSSELQDKLISEQQLWHVAHHDSLTGLANRQYFEQKINKAIINAARESKHAAIMSLNIDRFKTINDSFGHAIGDKLLQAVSDRLRSLLPDTAMLARIAGNEFGILLPSISDTNEAKNQAGHLLIKMGKPLQVEAHIFHIAPSIGISYYPESGHDAYQLVKNSNIALHHAKTLGKNNFSVFDTSLHVAAKRAFTLESKLRRALDNGEMSLNFQAQVNFPERKIIGIETLVRWNDVEEGFISPSEFIPIAEESGLIIPLGKWILHEALKQNRDWQSMGFPPVPIAVNLSPLQFRQASLVSDIVQLLQETGQPPELLELEITEGTLMEDVDDSLEKLKELASLGIQLSIDDFGTGYSSLNYLKKLPVHQLKIDQSFVRELGISKGDAAIVKAIINLADAMGLKILAEGVENSEQVTHLLKAGCNNFQGYLFCRPQPGSNLKAIFQPFQE